MATTSAITTAEQLFESPDLGRCELVRGEVLMMTPAGYQHGQIAAHLARLLDDFVRQHSLGSVTGAETGFHLHSEPDTVRAPDAAFVRAARLPAEPVIKFFPGAPDLAVEVLLPGDRAGALQEKIEDWLAAGTQAVWVVDPGPRTVAVYTRHQPVAVYRAADELPGGEVLPGFRVPVAEIFAR